MNLFELNNVLNWILSKIFLLNILLNWILSQNFLLNFLLKWFGLKNEYFEASVTVNLTTMLVNTTIFTRKIQELPQLRTPIWSISGSSSACSFHLPLHWSRQRLNAMDDVKRPEAMSEQSKDGQEVWGTSFHLGFFDFSLISLLASLFYGAIAFAFFLEIVWICVHIICEDHVSDETISVDIFLSVLLLFSYSFCIIVHFCTISRIIIQVK